MSRVFVFSTRRRETTWRYCWTTSEEPVIGRINCRYRSTSPYCWKRRGRKHDDCRKFWFICRRVCLSVSRSEQSASFKIFSRRYRYEVIQPPVADLIPRPKITRSNHLTELEWLTYIDDEGRIENSKEIRRKIFAGVIWTSSVPSTIWKVIRMFLQGIEPSLRSEVWKFLLGYYPWESTLVERKELRDSKVEEYFRMKLQWRSLSNDQESRFAAFKQRKDLIGKSLST